VAETCSSAPPVFVGRDVVAEEFEAETDDAADYGPERVVKKEAGIDVGEQVEDGAEKESQPVAGFPILIL
jgi:hypothetical protein